MRQLTLATVLFLLSVSAIVWFVSGFVLEDFSQAFVSRVIAQAKAESEEFARMVNESPSMGEGDAQAPDAAWQGSPIDADALLGNLAPQIFDEHGQRLDALASPPIPGTRSPELGGVESGPRRRSLIAGTMETQGQEWQYRLNGELIGRDAVQFINVRFPGGFQHLAFRRVEGRHVNPAVRDDPNSLLERVPVLHRPSTRRVLVAWESQVAGQPAQIEAAIDADILDAGVAELRRRVIPKVIGGGALFVLLLLCAYVYVLRLLREVRLAEAGASEQALLARVGMLAAGLAHEIRNPLTAVQMNLQLLEEDLAPAGVPGLLSAGALPPEGEASELRVLFRATQREIRRLGALVNSFLAYARPGEPQRQSHSVAGMIRDCVDLLRPMAAGAGVELAAELPPAEDTALVDEAMIKQALMNVVINAIEAVPHPGGLVQVTARREPKQWRVGIADNGPGLPEDPESLFRVFLSTKKGGTGLGLAISRSLVEQHGGRLDARPGTTGGAVFELILPAEVLS